MKNRNDGLDALRNLSMMMVVLLHVLQHGGALNGADFSVLSLNTAILWILELGSVCAVNCFGMLSGYFGVQSRPKVATIMKLWLQVTLYSVGIYFAWAIMRMNPAKAAGWMRGLTPITEKLYWYYTAYVGLYLLMPALNQLLKCTERNLLRRWIALFLAAVFIERLLFDSDVFKLSGGCSVLWLALLYAVGGYFRLHGETSRGYGWLSRHGFKVYGLSVMALGLYWWLRMSGRFPFLGGKVRWAQITTNDSFVAVFTAICLFAACSAWKPKGWLLKFSAWCAPAAFAVYLIHTHPVFWKEILGGRMLAFSRYPVYIMLMMIAGSVLGIFIFGVIVERVRLKVFSILRIDILCDKIGGFVERAALSVLG